MKIIKDKSLIPKGLYCYDGDYICPYWKLVKNRPDQYNGWCNYLEKGDIEINNEIELIDCKTKEEVSVKELDVPWSLLWDMCKECGINDEYQNENPKYL